MVRKIFTYFLIFAGTFLIYKNIYPEPRNWYDHYLYQARSFVVGRADIPDLPEFFQDKIEVNGKTYTPFPPMPALLLAPVVKFFPGVTQQEVSVVIGALNAVLAFILLAKFTSPKKAFLLTLFFAFGTVAFWSVIVGTTWYFAHNVALMFFFLSLISFKNEKDFMAGVFFSLAVLSRYPVLIGVIFYILALFKDKKRLVLFLSGAFLAVPAQFLYDWIRFGDYLQTGYVKVYQDYVHSSYPYTFMQLINPGSQYFGYIDPRNIPLHLFTFLLFPPIITESLQISPSPYGMGILFTTPLIFVALRPNFKDVLERNLFIGAVGIALIDFMHYMQGWVQFGYRFLLDFLPFLLIILALRFELKKKHILLLILSVAVSTWGTLSAIRLGW